MAHYIEPSKRIQFVKARDEFHSSNIESTKLAKAEARKLDGKEIASFYRELISERNVNDSKLQEANIGDPSTSKKHEIKKENSLKPSKKKVKRKFDSNLPTTATHEPITQRDERLWFKAAASNDLKKVKELLSRGISIDSLDFWNSTALICAAASGADDVVEFLMENQADWTRKNQTGFTAAGLARKKGLHDIADYIENFWSFTSFSEAPETSEPSASTFCEHCNQMFFNHQTHHCSIVHIVNTSQPPRPGYAYGIPSSNVGYQILKERGWTEAHGLGKQGEGRKYPLKTTLKRDRKGLGIDKLPLKVTHFEAGDLAAVKAVPKLGKRSWHKTLAEQKKKEKAIENRIRRAVSDFDEYPGYV